MFRSFCGGLSPLRYFFLLKLSFAIYLCAAFPGELNSWLDLIIAIAFALGAVLMTYTTYPENVGSTLVADALCCKLGKPKGGV
jgi:hypothetical protein